MLRHSARRNHVAPVLELGVVSHLNIEIWEGAGGRRGDITSTLGLADNQSIRDVTVFVFR